MGKILTVAAHEFGVNFSRRQYMFFAFVLPALVALLSIFTSVAAPPVFFEMVGNISAQHWLFLVPSVIAIIFSLSIFLSANYMLQGIAIEKENRIMEVLLSSISFQQLLVGKVLGLGLLGLIQLSTWTLTGFIMLFFSTPALASFAFQSVFSIETILLYLIFFILGYLLYATILAAIGAVMETRGEAQQIGSLLTVFAWLPVSNTMFLQTYVGSVLSGILTVIPFTAPVAVMIKIFTGTLTIYEAVLSITILVITIAVIVIITSSIFRVESILYGKRLSLKQLLRVIAKNPKLR